MSFTLRSLLPLFLSLWLVGMALVNIPIAVTEASIEVTALDDAGL